MNVSEFSHVTTCKICLFACLPAVNNERQYYCPQFYYNKNYKKFSIKCSVFYKTQEEEST